MHQKDPGLAKAFVHAGYTEIIDDNGLIRSGKAEGKVTGLVEVSKINRLDPADLKGARRTCSGA